MPSVDQLQAMSIETISKHRLTHILHGRYGMDYVSMKFSGGCVSPEAGSYNKAPETEVPIPDYPQIG